MLQRLRVLSTLLPCLALVTNQATADDSQLTFERHIRPIFRAHCYDCHGAGKTKKGNLDLRLVRLMLQGGESGPAIKAGDAKGSYVVERIREGSMPPGDHRVPAKEIAIIARWIDQGAKTARPEPKKIDEGLGITPEERAWWSFQPITRPAPPKLQNKQRIRNDIDAFLLVRMREQGLGFAPDADRATLIRRLYLDLIGLPPTIGQVRQFVNDKQPHAYSRLVDRLLDSPRYGERWGRHWLDVAGYADSEGYTNDDRTRPYAYKYRDYVIRAFNDDMPFDRFIQEQLAGDEMVAGDLKNLDADKTAKLTATGFLRMAADGTASKPADMALARNQVVADTIKIVSSSLLGLSVGCAQCHDHRYDPISHVDYHRIRAVFEPAYNWKQWRNPTQRRVSLYTDEQRARRAEIQKEVNVVATERNVKQSKYVQLALEKEYERYQDPLKGELRAAKETPANKQTEAQKKLLKQHPNLNVSAGNLYQYNQKHADEIKAYAPKIAAIQKKIPVEDFVRVLTEVPGQVPKTHLFHRGDHRQPQQEIAPGGLTVAAAEGKQFLIQLNDKNRPTTGRRLAYAKWLTNGKHPLVARVIVNRIWLHHFGRGIVSTPDEFGKLGTLPTHPKLLDWLASRFMADGWSIKKLHRLMLHSTAYRQSSLRNARGNDLDGANSLYWHKSVQRLEAEVLRDRILMASGQLDDKMFGPAVGVKADDAGQISVSGGNRRSIYVLNRRTQPVAMLQVFDAPVMTVNCSKRTNSTVALQSLLLMNSDTILNHAKAMAIRINVEAGKHVKAGELHGVNIPLDPLLVDSPWSFGFGHLPPADKSKTDKGKVAQVAFQAFPKFVKGRWQTTDKLGSGPAGYSSLLANGGHPHGTTSRPIRRWTSPVTGNITIKGSLRHGSTNGDGVRLTVYSSRLGKQGSWEVANSDVSYSVEFKVHKGDVIDTIVDERSTHTSDSFNNTYSIPIRRSRQAD